MNLQSLNIKAICLLCLFIMTIHLACKKLITVKEPINTITTADVFSTDALATSAMAGAYSVMINGNDNASAFNSFSAGISTYLGGVSSDELYSYLTASNGVDPYNTNHVTIFNSGTSFPVWSSAYTTIYKANAVIEGIAASKSAMLHDDVRNELTAEAKFIRAFSYFYLTNFFGDVPMALTVDFNQTQNLPRMPQQQVYAQIIKDLKEAQAALSADYSIGKGERIIPNKWAATLLLARVYLYMRDYTSAAAQATAVVNNASLFALEGDLNNVFLTNSREAVWQLKQSATNEYLKNATAEGYRFLPPALNWSALYCLTDQLLSGFEPGDQRRIAWVGATDNSDNGSGTPLPPVTSYYPYKYKIGSGNGDAAQPLNEYYMTLRFAEAYLIRAEAAANGAAGSTAAAIADLNVIRNRAGLPNLANTLSQQQVIAAVAKENQIEFFAEWGHRWFDLKRTGQASGVLSVIPLKQPWAGDYQLLYPIPPEEIKADHFLMQNPGY
jgi:hypothetical protein